MLTLVELEILLEDCKNGNRLSQKRIYHHFYSLGMSVSMRYAQSQEEAQEICHDGFIKAFAKINDCAGVGSFKAWLRQIFVRSAIDYFRKYRQNKPKMDDLAVAQHLATPCVAVEYLSIEEKMALVQQLPPSYRMAFNLYAIEGYSTVEIAKLLEIAEGTVRANLVKARLRLKTLIEESNKISPRR